MSDSEAAPAPRNPAAAGNRRFESAAALRAAHQILLERQAGSDTEPPQEIPTAEIATFLESARATGEIIADAEERRLAQRILDYWSADLVAGSRGVRLDAGPVQLAAFLPPASTAAEDAAFQRPEDARQYIRLSALARQWRDSGAPGYLLSGDALSAAEKFARDPDVAALIQASRAAGERAQRRRQKLKNMLLALMTAAIVALGALSGWAIQERSRARATAADLQKALDDNLDLLAQQTSTNRDITARLQEAESRQRLLDDALETLSEQVAAGSLSLGSVRSAGLRDELLARVGPMVPYQLQSYRVPQTLLPSGSVEDWADAAAAAAGAAADQEHLAAAWPGEAVPAPPQPSGQQPMIVPPEEQLFTGYDAGFLGPDLPLPELGRAQAETAYQGGAPILYHNFSIVLDARRRLAILSATNFDRARSRSLPSAPDWFQPDARIPAEVQPDRQFFEAPQIAFGQLVERNDIAWGDALPADPVEAAAFVAQVTGLYPNLVPQQAVVNREAWRAVKEWIRLRHNPGASRIAIFAGPIFAAGDTTGTMPEAFWKIAVSTEAGVYKNSSAAPLVVEAFIVPNDRAPGREARAYSVSVDEIAARTGLRFPPAIADASRPGDLLAARVADLGHEDRTVRVQIVQDILDLIRRPTAADADQPAIIAALLRLAAPEALAGLSASGKVNLFFLLSQVPAASWGRDAWLPLKAEARRLLAVEPVGLGPQARGHLDTLRERLGLAAAPPQTVQFQFAGIDRAEAEAISHGLKALGWNVPGIERVKNAPDANEVRYHPGTPADAAAARLLAADLQAAGVPGVVAKPLSIIPSGSIEVWISR